MSKNKEYYPVYEIDICFEQWASDTVMVGAKSEEDLVEHIKDVFPDYQYKASDLDLYYEGDDEDCKLMGNIITEPRFTKKQFKEICNLKDRFKRIRKVKNLYTDKLYQIITSHGYYE